MMTAFGYYLIVLVILPIPSISQVTVSPGFKKFGGTKPMPTPAGVPVAIMVPAFSVIPCDNSEIMCAISKISRLVLLS